MEREAFVSLATNDSYATGAIALGKSLRDTHTQRRLALLITDGVSQEMRGRLSRFWDELVVIEELDSGDTEHLALLTRPELGVTFSKIHAWRLTQYTKCVFLDADTLVLQNVDELFDREELSAAPDIGWPDCFNSGVFVFEPSLDTYSNLLDLALQEGSFDGGDQGLLNLYWRDWATKDIKYHLLFIYNVVPNVTYGYAPAFQQFGRNAKIIHFIGPVKPWQHRYLPEVDSVVLCPGSYATQHAAHDFIRRWWQVYSSTDQPPMSSQSSTYSRGLPSSSPPQPPSPSPPSTHVYHPAEHVTNHSYVYVPSPPHFIYDVPTTTSPSDSLVVSSRGETQILHTPSLDHQSDLDHRPFTSQPQFYHFQHFPHTSLSQYTPGSYGHLYMSDLYDPISLASPSEQLAPRPITPPIPIHDPFALLNGSTEKDELVVSETLVADSVLPFHSPSPVPSLPAPPHDPPPQEGHPAPVMGMERDSSAGGTVFCDSFQNIQARLDAILEADDDVSSQDISVEDTNSIASQ